MAHPQWSCAGPFAWLRTCAADSAASRAPARRHAASSWCEGSQYIEAVVKSPELPFTGRMKIYLLALSGSGTLLEGWYHPS